MNLWGPFLVISLQEGKSISKCTTTKVIIQRGDCKGCVSYLGTTHIHRGKKGKGQLTFPSQGWWEFPSQFGPILLPGSCSRGPGLPSSNPGFAPSTCHSYHNHWQAVLRKGALCCGAEDHSCSSLNGKCPLQVVLLWDLAMGHRPLRVNFKVKIWPSFWFFLLPTHHDMRPSTICAFRYRLHHDKLKLWTKISVSSLRLSLWEGQTSSSSALHRSRVRNG